MGALELFDDGQNCDAALVTTLKNMNKCQQLRLTFDYSRGRGYRPWKTSFSKQSVAALRAEQMTNTVRVLWAADTLGSNSVIRTKQATIHEWLSGCWLRQMQWWSYGPKDDHRLLVFDHWISWQLATYIGRCVNRSKLDRLKWTRRMVKETRQIGFWTCLLQ